MAKRQAFVMCRNFFLPDKGALMRISSGLKPGETWFGYTIPQVEQGNVYLKVSK